VGNAPRTLPDVPRLKNWDFSLFKSFKITERFNLQYRAELFNFLNTPTSAAIVRFLGLRRGQRDIEFAAPGADGVTADFLT